MKMLLDIIFSTDFFTFRDSFVYADPVRNYGSSAF